MPDTKEERFTREELVLGEHYGLNLNMKPNSLVGVGGDTLPLGDPGEHERWKELVAEARLRKSANQDKSVLGQKKDRLEKLTEQVKTAINAFREWAQEARDNAERQKLCLSVAVESVLVQSAILTNLGRGSVSEDQRGKIESCMKGLRELSDEVGGGLFRVLAGVLSVGANEHLSKANGILEENDEELKTGLPGLFHNLSVVSKLAQEYLDAKDQAATAERGLEAAKRGLEAAERGLEAAERGFEAAKGERKTADSMIPEGASGAMLTGASAASASAASASADTCEREEYSSKFQNVRRKWEEMANSSAGVNKCVRA